MTKPKKGIGAWLADVFGTSHKAISENLSAEEYSQFVEDASKLQNSEKSGDEEEESEEEEEDPETEEEETEEEDTDSAQSDKVKNADPQKKNVFIDARVTELEKSLKASDKLLKAEQKSNGKLKSQITELEGKLKNSEEQKTKLRNSVNQLGDEDLSDSETVDAHLTQADIEARESYNKRKGNK